MKMHNRFIIVFCLLAVLTLGCGPDAKRDNPLDPVNGSGVSGIVSAWGGGAVSNAVVTAVPANLSVRTNSSGQYNIELEGGRTYFLTAEHPYYHTRTDTVIVPSDGRLKKNFYLHGKPRIESPKVITECRVTTEGQIIWDIMPSCLMVHPDGETYLNNFRFKVTYRTDSVYVHKSFSTINSITRSYLWGFKWNYDSLSIVNGAVTFSVDSLDSIIQTGQALVPQRMNPPSSLYPSNIDFTPPGMLRWDNGATACTVRVEIWKDITVAWSRDLSNIDSIYCDAVLESGRDYLWRVINIDTDGNRGVYETKFSIP